MLFSTVSTTPLSGFDMIIIGLILTLLNSAINCYIALSIFTCFPAGTAGAVSDAKEEGAETEAGKQETWRTVR